MKRERHVRREREIQRVQREIQREKRESVSVVFFADLTFFFE